MSLTEGVTAGDSLVCVLHKYRDLAHAPTVTLTCMQVAFGFKMTQPDHAAVPQCTPLTPASGPSFGGTQDHLLVLLSPHGPEQRPGEAEPRDVPAHVLSWDPGRATPLSGPQFFHRPGTEGREERNDISIPYISKEIISYVRPEAQLPGNILEGADSWGQCWPRPR